jgi:hypothetical protein
MSPVVTECVLGYPCKINILYQGPVPCIYAVEGPLIEVAEYPLRRQIEQQFHRLLDLPRLDWLWLAATTTPSF